MLALSLMLSKTYYAQNYAGIIGLGLQHGRWVAIIISVRVKQNVYTGVASYTHALYTARSAPLGIDLHHAENQKSILLFIRLIKIITSTIYIAT